jgi:hypothetical protein
MKAGIKKDYVSLRTGQKVPKLKEVSAGQQEETIYSINYNQKTMTPLSDEG